MRSNNVNKRRRRPDKRRFWPVVFWGFDKTPDGRLIYKPSIAHNSVCRPYHTWEMALTKGMKTMEIDTPTRRLAPNSVFMLRVLHQEQPPDISKDSPLRLFVKRMDLSN